jgi:glycosyltransferase involved in cell wall biosynthesis
VSPGPGIGPSTSQLVIIPSYNTGALLERTVRDACAAWNPVWVVIDGSTDGTPQRLRELASALPGLRVFELPSNQGKGAAAALIPAFMRAAAEQPDAMILGRPVFDASAPLLRVRGRRISNGWTNLETLGAGIADSLYGFRVYPIAPLVDVMRRQPWMRRFDFDTEAVVRLAWRGVRPLNIDAPVKYLAADEGGVSHFRYGRDNLLLTWMHLRLMIEFMLRLPLLLFLRLTSRPPFAPR